LSVIPASIGKIVGKKIHRWFYRPKMHAKKNSRWKYFVVDSDIQSKYFSTLGAIPTD
jgi:hypothetical protein